MEETSEENNEVELGRSIQRHIFIANTHSHRPKQCEYSSKAKLALPFKWR